MINISDPWLKKVQEILKKIVPDCDVWAYGSRVCKESVAHRYSDLDIVVIGKSPLDFERISALRDVFSESTLPIIVDVHDWCRMSKSFQEEIRKKHEVIQVSSS